MTESASGIICAVYHGSATFSAGAIRTEGGKTIRFRGRFCANEGDCVTLVGRWQDDPKYGPQFVADSVSYSLPETKDGLIRYLADHPAFIGIGEATARKLVEHAGNAERLEQLLTGDLSALHKTLRISLCILENLRDAWLKHAGENRVRTFLAAYDLSPRQMDKLLGQFGEAVVGILRNNPYQLIRMVDGYGFRRVDEIARKMGVPKNHPGRIDAGILYCLCEEIGNGHTWTGKAELLDLANNLLALDDLNSRDVILARMQSLKAAGDIVADGDAFSEPRIFEAERLVQLTLQTHAWREPIGPAIAGDDSGLEGDQLAAYRNALGRQIGVISGSAGTGKTYVVARLAGAFLGAGLSVALCAPTGKAAKRIEEVMRGYGVGLSAHTIHRLLHYDGTTFHRNSLSDTYLRNGDIQPAYDAVIIDESSMIDVPLMAEVFRRIDFGRTRVVLVGDHNQLPPVGPGNILRDILAHKLAPAVILSKVHRQAGVLKTNSSRILAGAVAPSAGAEHGWIVVDGFREPEQIQARLRDLVKTEIPDRLGFDPLRDVQVVTPTHKGPLGTIEINRQLQYLFHGDVGDRFVVGDKVIQTANDYETGVMNGSIGFVVETSGTELLVDFEGIGRRLIKNEKRQNVQLAYAITAHKAQGSEFPCVVVLCHKSHFFADRNWLYTAVTRAARTCILLGDKWGIARAAEKNLTILRRTLLSKWAAVGVGRPNEENRDDEPSSLPE